MGDKGSNSDMMGSRADMISMKIDEVARNQIWREHLVKEAKLEGPQMEFQFNPATVSTVTVKPTLVDPREFSQSSKGVSSIEEKIKHISKTPQQKFDMPQTEAQGVGWMQEQAWKNGRVKVSRKWYRGKGTTDVTRFADAYCTMSGCSPFADKGNR